MATKNDFELSAKDFVVSSPNPLYDRQAVQNHINVGKSQDMRRQIKCQPSIKQIGILPAVNCPEKIVNIWLYLSLRLTVLEIGTPKIAIIGFPGVSLFM